MKKNSINDLNGVINVNKPSVMTSRDVVNKISHILGTKKVGHTGTLDPLATGVLVVTVGKYTKLNDALMSAYKEYIATFKLGVLTDTLDIEGTILDTKPIGCNKQDIEDAILSFKGKYIQEVPKYSAVKVDGKRLYEYARSGIDVELPKREVEIKDIEILDISNDTIKIKCTVSKGTYIRSLIRDIGEKLKAHATMTELERTKQGLFDISDSYTLEEIEEAKYKLLSIEDVLRDITVIELDDSIKKKVINGVPLNIDCKSEFILFKENDNDIALYRIINNKYNMFIKL